MMKIPSGHCAETDDSLILSNQNHGWENLFVEQFREPPGEENCHHSDEHTICLALDTRPIHLLQICELKQRDRSISDIALQCGFNSHSHLSKQFRQLTGTTPKAYRLH